MSRNGHFLDFSSDPPSRECADPGRGGHPSLPDGLSSWASRLDGTHGCGSVPAWGGFSSCRNHTASILWPSENIPGWAPRQQMPLYPVPTASGWPRTSPREGRSLQRPHRVLTGLASSAALPSVFLGRGL